MAKILQDSVLIVVLGTVLGLAANAVSPRGLSLTRDYFGGTAGKAVRAESGSAVQSGSPGTDAARPATDGSTGPGNKAEPSATPSRTKHGLPLATHEQVAAWFRDPSYAQQKVIFVDARDEAHYAEKHIPGAYPFDHYHPDRYIANVLAAAQLAHRIIVYCHGGDCEDSELAFQDLVALGVPESKLVIYGGGITEWVNRKMPVATGPERQP